MPTLTEITGTLRREHWRPKDCHETGDSFVIASLEDGTSLKGNAPVGELTPGLPYKFVGQWESEAGGRFGNGKTFKFQGFYKADPHSRMGVIKYLSKYAQGVGPAIAGVLYDIYGTDAVKNLRLDPEKAANDVNESVKRNAFSVADAVAASRVLKSLALLEDTRIELANLLSGRGFPGQFLDTVLSKWGPLAAVRIKRDPLSLMVFGFPGCGFARCDKLYIDLGLPPGRVKRQMLCLWKALRDDGGGHTWQPVAWAEGQLKRAIAGAPPMINRALRLGVKSGWLAVHRDERGSVWVAQGEAAAAERTAVDAVARLARWELPPACSDLGTPREYGEWLALQRAGSAAVLLDMIGSIPVPEATTEDKVRRGVETGVCQFCGRVLINPESRRRGYGPICAQRHNLPWEGGAA